MPAEVQKKAMSEWAGLENRLDRLVDKAYQINQLESAKPNCYMYRESENELKIFKATPAGFQLVESIAKGMEEEEQEVQSKVDPLKYLTETVLELSAVEDAQEILSGLKKATKKEDGALSLIESNEPTS